MFRTNPVVHHQEHGTVYCITQFGTIGTIVQASPVASSLTRLQASPVASNWTGLQDCTDCTKLCNTLYYAVLLMMND